MRAPIAPIVAITNRAAKARARAIVEFGASFGISTLHLAAALKDNGGGKLITTEFEATGSAEPSRRRGGHQPVQSFHSSIGTPHKRPLLSIW